ncbi:MAG TPA: EscU/YscU/HrcU family type III secretion system export apparatus switch protein [Kofleriaceae bacterium]|nr:EscU/YscU/HrcU family type III secretion system export apparatus switch protein [Kofleriaceae bacterium]
MSDPQRTHKATPKRVREFRKRGEIALSRDVVSTASLIGGAVALCACAGLSAHALTGLARDAALATDGQASFDLAGAALHGFLLAVLPVVLGAAVCAVIAIASQLGWPPAWKKLQIDFTRISPAKNLAQIFAPSALLRRTATAFAKLALVGTIVFGVLRSGIATHALDPMSLGALAWTLIRRALVLVILALAALAAIDYVLARRRIAAKMRMSTEEVKREHREAEGDPHLRGKRKARMRELAKRRMAAAVAKADVVVVNPTHYAVALRYDEKTDHAPIVVAKGIDESAEKIRELARKHGVPVLSRPPLARALHKHVKEGRPIPANLYRAVAEVLAYVYRLRHGGRR